MPLVPARGIQLFCECHGEGEPVLLVGPAWWPSTPWTLSQVPALSRHFQTVIFDPRGVGRSDKPLDGYTVREYAADAMGLLDALRTPSAHLVGFALGAACCVAAAQDYPDRVRSLVLGATPADPAPGQANPEARIRRVKERIAAEGYERYITHHIDNDEFAFSTEYRRRHPEATARLARLIWEQRPPEECYYRQAVEPVTSDIFPRLGEVRCPALVLVGDGDRIARGASTPADYAPVLARQIPDAKLVVLPGVKHMLYWEAADEVNRLLLEFLRNVH